MSINNRFFKVFITVLTAVVMLLSVSMQIAYADPGDDGGVPVADDGGDYDGGSVDDGSGEISQGDGDVPQQIEPDIDSGQDTPVDDDGQSNDTSVPETSQDPYQEIRDEYISRLDDLAGDLSQYTPNENLEYLPQVTPKEVVAATAEPLPDVAVSDATLFSGIVMWLCVAVGISVVAGVMVSKRIHRRGA